MRGRGWRTNNKYRRNFQWLTWKGRERVGNGESEEREGRGEGIGGEGWEAKGALDFDICPWAHPELLVTPVARVHPVHLR